MRSNPGFRAHGINKKSGSLGLKNRFSSRFPVFTVRPPGPIRSGSKNHDVHLTRRLAQPAPYSTHYNSIRQFRWSDAGPELQNLTSMVRFWFPSKLVQPDPSKERTTSCNFKLSNEFSSTIWQISVTKTPNPVILDTIWGEKHRIWRNLYQIRLDRTGSWTDQERSR